MYLICGYSIMQDIYIESYCSSGDGGVYPTAIQALLPRLLLAAAPGRSSCENHRQCLKVSGLTPNCPAI